jgi:hypothetical protein
MRIDLNPLTPLRFAEYIQSCYIIAPVSISVVCLRLHHATTNTHAPTSAICIT